MLAPEPPYQPATTAASVTASVFVSVNVAATVVALDDLENALAGLLGPGDALSGEFVYDATVPDSHKKGDRGRYVMTAAPSGIELSAPGAAFQSDGAAVAMTVTLLDDKKARTVSDVFEVKSTSNLEVLPGVGVAAIVVEFVDDLAVALSSDALAGVDPAAAPWTAGSVTITGASGWKMEAALFSVTGGDHPGAGAPAPLGTRKRHADNSL